MLDIVLTDIIKSNNSARYKTVVVRLLTVLMHDVCIGRSLIIGHIVYIFNFFVVFVCTVTRFLNNMIAICHPLNHKMNSLPVVDNVVVGIILFGCLITVTGSFIYGTVLVCVCYIFNVLHTISWFMICYIIGFWNTWIVHNSYVNNNNNNMTIY